MKKIYLIILIIALSFLSACTASNDSKNIILEDAFSITPYINIIGKKNDIRKYEASIYNDLSEELTKLDDKFSVNKEDSIVSKINQNSGKEYVSLDDEALKVISAAYQVSLETEIDKKESKYDITIYPLVEKWNFKERYFHGNNYYDPLDEEEALSLCELVSYKKILFDDNKIMLKDEGMKIDLGSIVKGYACDKLAEIMDTKYPYFSYIINIGGNIFTKGTTKRESRVSDFHIGIQTPFYDELKQSITSDEIRENAYYVGYVTSTQGGTTVVTSGIYERYIKDENGKMYHHILDKETGYPIDNELYSITIIYDGKNMSIHADAYSTALFSMGLGALSFANEKSLSIVVVTKGKEVYVSEKIKDRFVYNEVLNSCGYTYKVGNN